MKFKSQESILRAFHPPKTIPRAAKPGSQDSRVPACCPVLPFPGKRPVANAWVKEATEAVMCLGRQILGATAEADLESPPPWLLQSVGRVLGINKWQ